MLSVEDKTRVESVLDYIEDIDLRRRMLPYIKAFSFGLKDWRLRINCITNPYMYEQGMRANGNHQLSDGKLLSLQSSAAGLRTEDSWVGGRCDGQGSDSVVQ
ncbi:unnamed protein product [Arabidopsis lyrata]|uniref:Uncharacterized protein n=1 Tax=Arabidopsis lyrata subsp. lyrata TaxID=81972 RepID=D7LZH9_ARALL|nr:hypothetical protein ARALYDRAFT_911464 [Arabidopsis lyrata subsp. lyrata]CAH8272946.1 unnamed protein product [Arabidopsis lyrata]